MHFVFVTERDELYCAGVRRQMSPREACVGLTAQYDQFNDRKKSCPVISMNTPIPITAMGVRAPLIIIWE